ncbi:MAG TPA: hypothetical protein DFR83_27535 [Deltaproteobacteria bacterium]|nr:hypothetical protein [Deltaproteobacteria bacterium]
MIRFAQPFATILILSACGENGRGGKSGWDGMPREPPACDVESIDRSQTDGFAVEAVDFTFEYDPNTLLRVGPIFTFGLGADISGIAAAVDSPGDSVGFALWGLDDQIWIDAARRDETDGAWWSEPYYHWGMEGGGIAMPIGASTVPDGGGCLFVQPAVLENRGGETGTLHLVTKHGDVGAGQIDINLVVVGGAGLSQAELDATLDRMDQVWVGGGGPAVGDIALYELDGSSLLYYADSNALRRTALPGAHPQAVNLFIIDDYADEPGTLGEAGGIPGPLGVLGIDGAGVIVALDGHRLANGTLDVTTMGETMAHEVGHQVGLFHTTEDDGSTTESLADTPDCPRSADTNRDGEYTAEECADYDGRNFMFWVAGNFTQDRVSTEQALVLSQSVVSR